jgi:hypothetical protein
MPTIVSDYLPDSFKNRLEFFKNLKAKIHDHAAPLSLNAAKLTAIDALLDPLVSAYQRAVDAEVALRAANRDATDAFSDDAAAFRALVNELKGNAGFTPGLGDEMGVFTSATAKAAGDIKPRLTATGHRGGVTLDGSKDYAETVNLYMRRKGQSAWTLIAPKRKRLPFEDQTPLAQPGTPEEREYLARGVLGDAEVGQDSDIVPATFTP